MGRVRCRTFLLIAGLAITVVAVHVAYATPQWTPEQIAEEFARSGAALEPRFELPPASRGRSTLDERAYFTHYRMLCDFLDSMQFSGAGVNNGGMIEGESGGDQNIIQTDNTQEAIRVWSQYAIWTGDTASYGPNIRLAQGYCGRFPAWREGAGYYSIHNCGWGFEAERKYREAYSDTSWTWYADSCALWVVANPLAFDPNSTSLGQLNPCAEGLGIGGLYPHTLYRQRTDWQNFAVNQARLLRLWFESNPQRLFANETWALCGGTALWGVCESLFRLYPDSGQTWLTQYAPQLDIWQSTGTWNHSFNTWYCNAQYVVYEITQDSTYWQNAVFITDSLIGLDTDGDGGIPPGRTFPSTNDHSWVSAYMGWMGMERIINGSPIYDVAAESFVSPSPLPHLAGDTLWVAARVVNHGVFPMSTHVTVTGSFFNDSADVTLAAGADTVLAFPQPWLLPDDSTLPPLSPLALITTSALDENPANDTLIVSFDIRRSVQVFGIVADPLNPAHTFPVRIEFYHEAYPESLWTFVEQSSNVLYANGTRPLMAGENRIRVIPQTARLMIMEQTAGLMPAPLPLEVDFMLSRTEIALIDDDAGDTLETYFELSMDSSNGRLRWWDKNSAGFPILDSIPSVIWFTGDDSLNCLDTTEQTLLENYLSEGGHLLLTGQNITDALGNSSAFLTEVLHCSSRTPDTDQRLISGIEGNPLSDGMALYLIGTAGAWNQTSPASVWPLEGATGILYYTYGNLETCGITGDYGNGKYVFLSFGLEAVSGASNSTTRAEFLDRCFFWFDSSLSTTTPAHAIISTFELAQNFPNPFNPLTQIRFVAPRGAYPVRLVVYNILGQEVRRLYDGFGSGGPQIVLWNGAAADGTAAASGLYICRLQAGSSTTAKTLHLLR